MFKLIGSVLLAIDKGFGKLLCAIGAHDFGHGWGEDGKGNSGAYTHCHRCGKVWEDLI